MHFPVGFVYHNDETPWPKQADGLQETKYVNDCIQSNELILGYRKSADIQQMLVKVCVYPNRVV